MMLSNMALAFSLNFIGILVIKRMSAVAYVLSGICKDILLVTLGAVMWNEVVTNQRESFTYVAFFFSIRLWESPPLSTAPDCSYSSIDWSSLRPLELTTSHTHSLPP